MDWVKTVTAWMLAGIANWFAWFTNNSHLVAEILAAAASFAAIIVTILHAITLRAKYKYYKSKKY
jgi:hypothetical protein